MNQCWMADCVTRRASASGWAQAPPPGRGEGPPPSCSCGGDGSAAASGDSVILLVEAFPGACGDGVPRGALALPEAGPSAHTHDVPPRACLRGRGAAMQQPILVLSASLTHTSRCRCVCHSLTCAPLFWRRPKHQARHRAESAAGQHCSCQGPRLRACVSPVASARRAHPQAPLLLTLLSLWWSTRRWRTSSAPPWAPKACSRCSWTRREVRPGRGCPAWCARHSPCPAASAPLASHQASC